MNELAKKVGARLTERNQWRNGMKGNLPEEGWVRIVDAQHGRVLGAHCFNWVGMDELTPDLSDWPTLGVLIGMSVERLAETMQDPSDTLDFVMSTMGDGELGEQIAKLWLEVTA